MTGMAPPASPLSASSLTQLSLSLIGIVLLIFAISWALKRLKLSNPRRSGGIAVIDELSLSPRDRILLIRVGDAQILVGVGATGLVPLAPLAVNIAIDSPTRTPVFADRLRDLMRRPGGSA